MFSEKNLQKALQERIARAASRGFTREYQNEKEEEDNTICYRELAPATLGKYGYAVGNWALLSRNESTDSNFPNSPVLTPQLLKLFAEFYIVSRDKIPKQKTERDTSRPLSDKVKRDVLNSKERFLVNGKDIDYLLRHLFVNDCHDYVHERVIVYGVADGAFKGHASMIEVLAAKPPKGRESLTLEWNETVKNLLFFRMVTSKGPKSIKALTFSLLRYNFTSLA
ncbi:uncharacterized protein N7529_007193 [Penicillium soppii]|uniref:uncharacterized protein n=1 Tax=Penicillium soppii TaxID=69789 RepID=UPI002549684E|nr:uncharacterized protein N7529_007193 [Penicillium soppii]KAJ5865277.1 hypothetical protein N7529_007193 [Penicillium soppii]